MHYRIAPLLALLATLTGCAMTPNVDRQFGSSLRQAQAQQTLNPDAWRNRAPVTGVDADAGASIYSNYVRSFRTPEAQNDSLTTGRSGTR